MSKQAFATQPIRHQCRESAHGDCMGLHRASLLAATMLLAFSSFVFNGGSSTRADETDKTKAASSSSSDERSQPANATGKQTVEDRTSRASARAKGELNFDDLKFEIEKGGKFDRSMIPKEIEELNKRTIRIRGFILPQSVLKMSGFNEFVLVRDNMECCFGPGAALYDCIMIKMEKGKSADFTTRPVAVRGKFEIKEFKYPDSDQHYAIYYLTATEVK